MNSLITTMIRLQNNYILPEEDQERILLSGDVLIKFKNGYSMTTQNLFRISFNAAFLDEVFELCPEKIDPDNFHKDTRFPKYFTLGIESIRYCQKCDKHTPMSKLWHNCLSREDIENQVKDWSKIEGVLGELRFVNNDSLPTYPEAMKMHFTKDPPDVEKTLKDEEAKIPKLTLISGSISEDEMGKSIHLNFFGKELTVIKKKVLINDEEEKDQNAIMNGFDEEYKDDGRSVDDFEYINNPHFNDLSLRKDLSHFVKSSPQLLTLNGDFAEDVKDPINGDFVEEVKDPINESASNHTEENKDDWEDLTRDELLETKIDSIKRKGKSQICVSNRRKDIDRCDLYNQIMGSTIERLAQTNLNQEGYTLDDMGVLKRNSKSLNSSKESENSFEVIDRRPSSFYKSSKKPKKKKFIIL